MPPFNYPIPKDSDHSQLIDLFQETALITIIIGIIIILVLRYTFIKLTFKNKFRDKSKNRKSIK